MRVPYGWLAMAVLENEGETIDFQRKKAQLNEVPECLLLT